MLRTRRSKGPEGAADGAGGDARVASLERENQRLRDLVRRPPSLETVPPVGSALPVLRSAGRKGREPAACSLGPDQSVLLQ